MYTLCYKYYTKVGVKSSYLLFLSLGLFSCAHSGYIDRKAEGWHFYEKLPKKDIKKREKTKKVLAPELKKDPIATLNQYKKKIEEAKATAVMNPTYQNVQIYMSVQKELMTKASKFAQKWMEVVYTKPQLDYTIKHPTSQAARHVYHDKQSKNMDNKIRSLSKTHGLFFFFSSSCGYCKKFAPIVKAFALHYGWEVIAISMDGTALQEFPNPTMNNGMAQKLGVRSLPTLLAVDPSKESIVPLSHGMSSQDQIKDRIRVLIIERNES